MGFFRNFVNLLQLWTTVIEANAHAKRALTCKDLTIPVQVPAQTPPIRGGNYTLSARYCQPSVQNGTRGTALQILVHGLDYTKDYWSGLAAPGTKSGQDQYSWVLYAANQGYPTLSIDRICNGNSSHPNAIIECQVSSQALSIHSLIQTARQGKLPGITTSFAKVIYVGHSYGSVVGNNLAITYPKDIDAAVLTGYSLKGSQNVMALPFTAAFLPAAATLPSRFGSLSSDPAYVVATQQNALQTQFFYGNFDPAFFQYSYDVRGTVAFGEVGVSGSTQNSTFSGPVYVLNGNQDRRFCSNGIYDAYNVTTPNCLAGGFLSDVKQTFPAASKFGFSATNDTGHSLNLHLTAQQSFKAAHDFLAQAGF